MRLHLKCMHCFQEAGVPVPISYRSDALESGAFEFTCGHGHKSFTIIQCRRHELLFELGIHAILDGYFREAISAFASSLERFYEFYVRVILHERGLKSDDYDEYWRTLKSQS